MPLKSPGLIDAQKGLVDRRIFSDPEIHRLELERIFARCWLYLGHECQLEKRGDFFTTYMGADPVLVCRGSDGRLRAFLNACRHRGNRVCRLDQGNAVKFTCSYHGWTYTNQGRLVAAPYFDKLDKSQWGLIPIPHIDSYKGLIFGNLDPDAPTLSDYLGDMAWYLDLLLDQHEGGTELVGGVHKWVVNANWKFAAENFIGDMVHAGITHASAFQVGFGGGQTSNRSALEADGYQVSLPRGHGIGTRWSEKGEVAFGAPTNEMTLFTQDTIDEIEGRLGAVRARKMSPVHGTVFPNLSFLFGTHTIRVWHPKGPTKTEVWSWCIVDRAAPPEVKESIRLHYLRRFSPAGTWEQDDADNWIQATETSQGVGARRFPLNYQMGLGSEGPHPELPGKAGDFRSDVNQRNFYKHWAELIES